MASNSKATPASLPCRRNDVPFKEFGPAEGMLLDLESGEYYGLEGAAVEIWKELDGRQGGEVVARHIKEAHGISLKEAEKDVAAFLRQLRAAGLLADPGTVDSGSGSPARGGRVRKTGSAAGYLPPRLTKRGNLRFLGQLD